MLGQSEFAWVYIQSPWGWSGGAMVLGKLPVPGRPTIFFITVGQGPIALAVGAGGDGGGRVVRWCWVNFQCRGVLQF